MYLEAETQHNDINHEADKQQASSKAVQTQKAIKLIYIQTAWNMDEAISAPWLPPTVLEGSSLTW